MNKLISISFLLYCFLLSTYTFAQDNWVLNMLSPGDVSGWSLTPTEDGNFIFYAGSSAGFGSGLDAGSYIVKVNPAGDIIWMNKFSETVISNYLPHVLEAVDGGYLIVQRNEVLKVNDNFEEEWSTTIVIGSGVNQSSVKIKKTSDGNYLLIGISSLIDPTYVLRKLDPGFNVIWNLETDYLIGLRDVIELSTGDFIGVLGSTLTKIDSEGNILWETEVEEMQSQDLRIFENPNGGFGVLSIADPPLV